MIRTPHVLLVASMVGCAPSQRTSAAHTNRAAASALALERDVARVAARHRGAQALWPGFDPLAIPLAVYDGHDTWLFRHPSPPDGFVASSAAPGTSVYAGRHPNMTANSSTDLGGVVTATVILSTRTAGDTASWAPLAIHEAFHVFQRAHHPAWSGNEADLFTYPTDHVEALTHRRLETEALRRALAAKANDVAGCWAQAALTVRQRRYAMIDSASAAYERGTELNEGLATHVEGRARGRASTVLPPGDFAPAAVRVRAYATGAALAALLDRLAPGWEPAFNAESLATLDGTLRRAVMSGRQCVFTETESANASRRADHDITLLVESRGKRLMELRARAGWRVVIDAPSTVLWPQGFDPLNVERLGTTTVLHSRFVKFGNERGSLQMLDGAQADLDAVSTGAGPHPLFNGVIGVEVLGLAEPVVRTTGDTINVTAPGFTAQFIGATVERSGQRLSIRLGR